MKKILIPMFGLLVLPLAAPSSAKFYSGDIQEYEKREVAQKHFDRQQPSKREQKTARNSAYGQPGSHGSTGGSLGKTKARSKGGSSKGEPRSYSRGSKGSKGSAGPHDGKPAPYQPRQWDMSKFKRLEKDHWSKDDFDKAMLCWLAPHMHQDKEFVNRYWNKWGYKWKWLHKYYKHKFHKHNPGKPPSEIPLPASSLLFGCALLGLATIGQRRRRH